MKVDVYYLSDRLHKCGFATAEYVTADWQLFKRGDQEWRVPHDTVRTFLFYGVSVCDVGALP